MRLAPPLAALAAVAAVTLTGCGSSSDLSGFHPSSSSTTSSSQDVTPTSETPTSETPTLEPTFEGKPADFKIGIKILKKTCFGSAGCNVTYRIIPEYVGLGSLPDTGTVEVTYVVKGLEDGDAINTFTIENGRASFDSEENGSTKTSKAKLTAAATDVSYQPS